MNVSGLFRPTLAGLFALGALTSACDLETVNTDAGDRSLAAAGLTDLRVDVGAGRLEVVGDPVADTIEVSATLVTYAFKDATEALDQLVFNLDRTGDRAFLRVELSQEDGWVDVQVRVPSALALDVADGSGDLEIRDVAGLRLVDDSGEAIIRGIAGDLVVTDASSGDLDLEAIEGDVRINDDSGEIRLSSVRGSVEIADESGDLMVRDVEGPVRITDGSGSIRVERVTGRVEINDGSGDITLIDAPDAWIMENESGEVFRR